MLRRIVGPHGEEQRRLPIFMDDSAVARILREVASSVPEDVGVFLMGGALRNAVYNYYFSESLPQRDFDLPLIGKPQKFISDLRGNGFNYGKIRRKDEVVLKKAKFAGSEDISDFVVLDIHISEEKDIRENIKKNANFTISCFALPLEAVLRPDWLKHLIALPGALEDLMNKRLRVNQFDYPTTLFACIRFMSQGFKQPSKEEVGKLLDSLTGVEEDRFERSVQKVFNYVGGEENARRLVRKLGIDVDIFDLAAIKKLRKP